MADNVTLDPGSGGDVIATDDIGGVEFQRIKLIHGVDGVNDGDVANTNPLPVREANAISTDNSTTTPLGISGNYTGTGEDVSQCATVTVIIDSSHDSATDGMTFEWSPDNTNWDEAHLFTYTAADGGRHFQLPVVAQYFRINYTNGGTAQTTFRVQTILHSRYVGTTIHRLGDAVDPDRSATVVKAAVVAQAAGAGDFVPIQATATGNLKTSLEEIDAALTLTLANGMANPTPLLVGSFNVGYNGATWDRLISGGTNADAVAVDTTGYQYVAGFNMLYNGTTWDRVRGDIANGIDVDVTRVSGTVTVDGSGVTQPISAASLPLPTGAATLAAQLPDGHNVTVDNASLVVDGSAVTQPISAASLPLPTGAATAAAQLADGHNVAALGAAAHDAAASGNPVAVSGVAQDMDDTAPPNRVSAEGDVARLASDRDGAVFAHPHGPQIWSYHVDGSSALTDATVHAAPGAGLSIYVTDIVFSAGAATAINAFLEEGASTVLGPYYLEAVAGRGMALHFQTPKKITANTALTITTSAAIAHSVDITGFIGAA